MITAVTTEMSEVLTANAHLRCERAYLKLKINPVT